jgi:hypothetical protein
MGHSTMYDAVANLSLAKYALESVLGDEHKSAARFHEARTHAHTHTHTHTHMHRTKTNYVACSPQANYTD